MPGHNPFLTGPGELFLEYEVSADFLAVFVALLWYTGIPLKSFLGSRFLTN